jgi:hypothetical protein
MKQLRPELQLIEPAGVLTPQLRMLLVALEMLERVLVAVRDGHESRREERVDDGGDKKRGGEHVERLLLRAVHELVPDGEVAVAIAVERPRISARHSF